MDLPIDLSGLINHRDGFQRRVLWKVKGSSNWPFSPPFFSPSIWDFKKRERSCIPFKIFWPHEKCVGTDRVTVCVRLRSCCWILRTQEELQYDREERVWSSFLIENQKPNEPRAQTNVVRNENNEYKQIVNVYLLSVFSFHTFVYFYSTTSQREMLDFFSHSVYLTALVTTFYT